MGGALEKYHFGIVCCGQRFALQLGACWAGSSEAQPDASLDAALISKLPQIRPVISWPSRLLANGLANSCILGCN